MIRSELIEPDDGPPTIIIRSRDRVEVHDLQHNILDARDATPAERAEHIAWEAQQTPGQRPPMRRTKPRPPRGHHDADPPAGEQ